MRSRVCLGLAALLSVLAGPIARPGSTLFCSRAGQSAAVLDGAAEQPWCGAGGVTPAMKAVADSLLVALLGRQFFEDSIVFDPRQTDEVAARAEQSGAEDRSIYYRLTVFSEVELQPLVRVGVTPECELVDAFGVPDCRGESRECCFIYPDSVRSLAVAAGLELGAHDGLLRLSWDPGEDARSYTYQWEVRGTVQDSTLGSAWALMRFDANDGQLLCRLLLGPFTPGEDRPAPARGARSDAPN